VFVKSYGRSAEQEDAAGLERSDPGEPSPVPQRPTVTTRGRAYEATRQADEDELASGGGWGGVWGLEGSAPARMCCLVAAHSHTIARTASWSGWRAVR
jgi:hypothetical protein